jgi:hypothetical protein
MIWASEGDGEITKCPSPCVQGEGLG